MGVRERFAEAILGRELTQLQEEARVGVAANAQYEFLAERLAELELALEDEGWQRIDGSNDREFSREGLRRIVEWARNMYLSHPLIRRAVNVQAFYVWGQGIRIQARHAQVNDVVQAFLDDRANKVEFARHQSRVDKEITLQTEGNIFLTLFVNPSTGRVRVRSIPFAEISDVITNPQDAKEPWFYKRVWKVGQLDPATGRVDSKTQTAYYPDWRYQPKEDLPDQIGEHPVERNTPICHLKAGGFSDMRFGVPEIYAALVWASAYRRSLEDDATRSRALAKHAYSLTTPGGPRAVAAAKAKLDTTIANTGSTSETNPPPLTGSTWIQGEGVHLDPIRLSGAALPVDHNRPLRLMVAAGTGTPDTILSGDADVGNLATAKTLDRPTELKMIDRQTLWADAYRDLLDFVIDWAVRAPNGPLKGEELVDEDTGERTIILEVDPETGEPIDRHVDVDFPDLLERDIAARVKAVVDALTASGHPVLAIWPPKLVARWLMGALGIDDVDEELAELFPEEGDGELPEEEPPPEVEEALKEAARELRDALVAHRNGSAS